MKRIIYLACATALTLASGVQAGASAPDNTVALGTVTRDGKKSFVYIAEKGESVYGIAHKFGWNPDTLALFNPDLQETASGQYIYYPCPAESVAIRQPGVPASNVQTLSAAELPLKKKIYTVPEPMGALQIARQNRMPLEDLFRLNPGLGTGGVDGGTRLMVVPGLEMRQQELRSVKERVRKPGKAYKAKKSDTWEKIFRDFSKKKNLNFTFEELRAANAGGVLAKGVVVEIPNFNDTLVQKYVPLRDALEDTPGGVGELYAKVHARKAGNLSATGIYDLNVSVLVSCDDAKDRRRDMEFLKGFMLALDGKQFPGYRITLHGVDLADYGGLQQVVNSGKLGTSDIVIYPADSNFPEDLADYCTSHGITLLNVFDAKTDITETCPQGVQLLPPSAYFYDRASDFLSRVMSDRTFIFIDFDENGDGDSMSAAMMDRLKKTGVGKIVLLPDAVALSSYAFNPMLSYTVVSDASGSREISETFKVLEQVVDKYPNMPLSIVGRPTWIVNAAKNEKLLQKLDTYIPARFYYDADAPAAKDFTTRFKALYDAAPLNTMPMYAAMGYDVANYFIDTFVKSDGDLNRSEQGEGALQLDFRPEREELWKGFTNHRVYLMHFTPFMTTDKIGL